MTTDETPTNRMLISLRPADDARLRALAAEHGTTPGIAARALVVYGLDRLADPEVGQAITDEKTRDRDRRSAVGRRVMENRQKE
ncbi:MAG: hypothetical protein QM658_03460 [Gordonia sp. (in: high G+C Gram-positive bacteria)]